VTYSAVLGHQGRSRLRDPPRPSQSTCISPPTSGSGSHASA